MIDKIQASWLIALELNLLYNLVFCFGKKEKLVGNRSLLQVNMDCKRMANTPSRQRRGLYKRLKFQGGKSEQHRAPYFLTGRHPSHKAKVAASATENKPPSNR